MRAPGTDQIAEAGKCEEHDASDDGRSSDRSGQNQAAPGLQQAHQTSAE